MLQTLFAPQKYWSHPLEMLNLKQMPAQNTIPTEGEDLTPSTRIEMSIKIRTLASRSRRHHQSTQSTLLAQFCLVFSVRITLAKTRKCLK